jgi:hypothetical protein
MPAQVGHSEGAWGIPKVHRSTGRFLREYHLLTNVKSRITRFLSKKMK